jgi:tetratricopeptide (TPR) repeat protein
LDSAYLDIRVLDRPEAGVRRLDAVVARRLLRNLPRWADAYASVASAYVRAGRPDRARSVLGQYDTDVRDAGRRRDEAHDLRRVRGEVAVAERRYDEGIRLIWSSDTSADAAPVQWSFSAITSLAWAYDVAGRSADAIAAYEQYLAEGHSARELISDPWHLAGTHERLAELYDERGDRAKAAAHYEAFVGLWKDADPELQPKVVAARGRLAALTDAERP